MPLAARIRSTLRLRSRARRAWLFAGDVALRRTSISDRGGYPALCAAAARDDSTFATFKQHPDYVPVLEHVGADLGRAYLDLALRQGPWLVPFLDEIRRNDSLGAPRTFDYPPYGSFSPTTLRYAKVLTDLVALFGPLDGMRIAEIGGGYGGQCFVCHQAARPASYAIYDLPPVLELQRVYLRRLGVDSVELASGTEIPVLGEFDLAISNYAFTECNGAVQRRYLDAVLRRAARGYVTCNLMTPRWYRSPTPDALLAAIPGSRFVAEEPATATNNRVWLWGDGSAA